MDFSDPDELDALARRLDERADLVRGSCRSFDKAVAGVGWQSVGAAGYRTKCRLVKRDVDGNAQELNDAADLLRRHADNVRDRIAWMHDMVDQLRTEAEEAWDAAEGAFEWGKDQAEAAWDTVTSWL